MQNPEKLENLMKVQTQLYHMRIKTKMETLGVNQAMIGLHQTEMKTIEDVVEAEVEEHEEEEVETSMITEITMKM